MTTWDRVSEWLLAYGIPAVIRFGAFLLIVYGFELDLTLRNAAVLLGSLLLLDFAHGWRNAAKKNPLFINARCAICGDHMKWEENYVTSEKGDDKIRVDWHRRHKDPLVIERVIHLAGF